ncbi:TPA: ABC transporter permease, partial [Streptococcus pyogenes]
QGILLGIGFLSGFFGMITSQTLKWINLIFPFGGSSFLALYRIKILNSSDSLDYIFSWDKSVPLNYTLYLIYCVMIYSVVKYLLKKKKGDNNE